MEVLKLLIEQRISSNCHKVNTSLQKNLKTCISSQNGLLKFGSMEILLEIILLVLLFWTLIESRNIARKLEKKTLRKLQQMLSLDKLFLITLSSLLLKMLALLLRSQNKFIWFINHGLKLWIFLPQPKNSKEILLRKSIKKKLIKCILPQIWKLLALRNDFNNNLNN